MQVAPLQFDVPQCPGFCTAWGSVIECRRRGGFCTFGNCRHASRPIGRCSTFQACCRSMWG
uniref:Beta-defensin-like domain-containing protein n=1 Tax=Bubo bubo TaxID=30461 RepID=A0A8C0F3P6_BUBBB